ncbi:LANO_0C07008g1_1 [Lachancea nothofagi CBS 11611]|uniref:LANO_0C07008g1_1 n=1 Tax=Lachancea nothofagi CBS 11611 TaxID=1266666 RepID=A0A1G4J912_9SACH|nr:LANO_0C07008g1_1 [Lachancea nothofagi CBS 11611]
MSNYIGDNPYNSNTFGKSLSLRVDGGFKAVSISPSGRDAVLASRQGLYVVDLDDPFSAPRWLHHITSWEVADVQWSPHPSKPSWVVSTSNQKALVWNLSRSSSDAIEHVLHGHFRAISDINFHPQHPEILATCSIDAYVHSWDMRSPRRAYYSASVWSAGASQVKWNFQNPNVMASAHSNDIYIWDLRKGCIPLHVLKGHVNSVNSIDFNRVNETEIMSCSNDGTVKFWDYSIDSCEPQRTVVTDFPVARGRYLPFGKGFCVMPVTGGNNSIYLSSSVTDSDSESVSKFQPIYIFKGHSDCVSDFLWRVRHNNNSDVDDREFQLVTWSKDCDLRLWPVHDSTYEKVNYKRLQPLKTPLPDHEYRTYRQEPQVSRNLANKSSRVVEHFVTKSGSESFRDKNKVNHLAWVSGVRLHHANSQHNVFDQDKLQNLGEEVSMVGHKFPKIVFEKISVSTGTLILTLNGPWSEQSPEDLVFLRIQVSFPSSYPRKECVPHFKIEENRELSASKIEEINEQLSKISRRYVDLEKYCLEPCLRFLLGEKINLDTLLEEEELLNLDAVDHADLHDLSSLESSDIRSGAISEMSRTSDEEAGDFDNKSSNDAFVTRSANNLDLDTTPIPKGCGATWTPSGQLVCFFLTEGKAEKKQQSLLRLGRRSATGFKDNTKPELLYDDESHTVSKRPKRYVETLSASSAQNSEPANSANESDSEESSDSFGDDWNDIVRSDITLRTRMPVFSNFKKTLASIPSDGGKSNVSVPKSKNTVIIQDFSHLVADKKQLALEYTFNGESLEAVCKYNAQVAETHDFEDVAHCWRMIANVLIGREERNDNGFGWDPQALGDQWFIKETMKYFEKLKNVQMLAMLSCILMSPPQGNDDTQVPRNRGENIITFDNDFHGNSARSHQGSVSSSVKSEDYFSTHPPGGKFSKYRPSNAGLRSEVNMAPSLLPDIKIEIIRDEVLDLMDGQTPPLLDPLDEQKYKSYRYQYAELLFYWGLLINRAELLHFNNTGDFFANDLWHHPTGSDLNGSEQQKYTGVSYKLVANGGDSRLNRICNYCELKVDGRGFACGNCQHIIHATCAKKWWEISDDCPSGCGCRCVEMFDVV